MSMKKFNKGDIVRLKYHLTCDGDVYGVAGSVGRLVYQNESVVCVTAGNEPECHGISEEDDIYSDPDDWELVKAAPIVIKPEPQAGKHPMGIKTIGENQIEFNCLHLTACPECNRIPKLLYLNKKNEKSLDLRQVYDERWSAECQCHQVVGLSREECEKEWESIVDWKVGLIQSCEPDRQEKLAKRFIEALEKHHASYPTFKPHRVAQMFAQASKRSRLLMQYKSIASLNKRASYPRAAERMLHE